MGSWVIDICDIDFGNCVLTVGSCIIEVPGNIVAIVGNCVVDIGIWVFVKNCVYDAVFFSILVLVGICIVEDIGIFVVILVTGISVIDAFVSSFVVDIGI